MLERLTESPLHGTLRGCSVLMTADTVGGVFTYALTLAGTLTSQGATVHLATMGARLHAAQRAAASAVAGLTVHESELALEWMDEPWDDVARAGEWLLALERQVQPDVVHLNGYCHAAIGFRAPVLVVGHSCVASWWEAVYGGSPPAMFDRYVREVKRGLAAADAVCAPSRAMLDSLERHYGAVRHGFVVPNGAPAPPVREGRALRKQHTVLAAGRLWDLAKNIEMVARVAPLFSGTVRVAGSARHPQGEERTFPCVEVLGWLDPEALGREMEAASIFAHPARYEPFGLAPLEAALRGCALVLGDIPSLREVWGDAAVYVDPNDDDALAAALDEYAGDEELRAEHAERARARAAWFTPQRMADGTVGIYGHLLSTRGRGASGFRTGVLQSCA